MGRSVDCGETEGGKAPIASSPIRSAPTRTATSSRTGLRNIGGADPRQAEAVLAFAIVSRNLGLAAKAEPPPDHAESPAPVATAGRAIVLVGMPGAGKSSIGRRLAVR